MGLVVSTIPAGGTLVSTTVSKGGTYIPVTPTGGVHTGYKFTGNTSSDLFTLEDTFDTSIYRILSMQDDMKTIAIQGVVSSEFELYLKYAEDLTAGNPVSVGFIALNNYLGSLGV